MIRRVTSRTREPAWSAILNACVGDRPQHARIALSVGRVLKQHSTCNVLENGEQRDSFALRRMPLRHVSCWDRASVATEQFCKLPRNSDVCAWRARCNRRYRSAHLNK
jgi:hypothetical protein